MLKIHFRNDYGSFVRNTIHCDIFIHNTYLRTENTMYRNHYSEYNN
jgi:hypothetical protein